MLKIRQVSKRELRSATFALVKSGVIRLRKESVGKEEEGVDQFVREVAPGLQGSLSEFRRAVKEHNGDTDAIANEFFTPDEIAKAEENEKELTNILRAENTDKSKPVRAKKGTDRLTRMLARTVFKTSYTLRTDNPVFADKDWGAVRFRESIAGDLPSLSAESDEQTPRYIAYLQDLFGDSILDELQDA
jgi:hypothetical protein